MPRTSSLDAVARWLADGGERCAAHDATEGHPADGTAAVQVYPRSYETSGEDRIVMVKEEGVRLLLAAGGGSLYQELEGEESTGGEIRYKACPLTRHNRLVLNRYFEHTRPRAFGTSIATIGLGDRLGLASPGHIRAVRGREIRPILAQQSVRELTLTGRTFEDVLDAAAFAVFQEGYKEGWGADGDHLKTTADIETALGLGFTMLTLDASEHIDNAAASADEAEVAARYGELAAGTRERLERDYADRTFEVGGVPITITRSGLMRCALIYGRAIRFMIEIYRGYIEPAEREIDFEISIDETLTPTEPAAHWFVASELMRAGVRVNSLAPRFCGEFQKGIDYIGDLAQFERELAVHARIADHFGYKLSVHSGSDKFSVFSLVAQYTQGRFHLKTAGTNWLEAVRTVARANPGLYRRMHAYALAHVDEALKYYPITADFNRIRPLADVPDSELPGYMNDNDARQLIHISYGLLLTAADRFGSPLFKEEFFRTLQTHERAYEEDLMDHIGKHLRLLGK